MVYEIKYTRNDGSVGAYYGDNKEAFMVEIKGCINNGWMFEANATQLQFERS